MNGSKIALNSTASWQRSVEQATWAILTTVSLYLVVVLVMFEVKRGKNPRNAKRRNGWTSCFGKNPMCILAALFTLLRNASLQIQLSLGTQSDVACQTFMFLYYTLNNLNLLTVYCMFWARQRNLYKDAVLRCFLTPFYRVVNVAVLVNLIVCTVIWTSFIFVGFEPVKSPIGCMVPTRVGTNSWLYFFGLLACPQVSLLCLMFYPLFRHYEIATSCCCSKGTIKDLSNKIQNLVTRLCVCAGVCVIADLILVLESTFPQRPTLFWLVYNLNMIINTVATVCTFRDWTERLFPWKHQTSSGAMATNVTKTAKNPNLKNKHAGHTLKDTVANTTNFNL